MLFFVSHKLKMIVFRHVKDFDIVSPSPKVKHR